MDSIPPKPRWQNPFIDKLEKLDDIIFTCARDNPQSLIPKIQKRFEKYSNFILEICSGSGGHLIELANRNTETLCIGVELRYKRLVRTAEKAKERGLTNLILLQLDAQFLEKVLPEKSCNRIYINFPDPWDGKTRWENKYLLSQEYLSSLCRLLKPKGTFHYKTDHSRRFHQVHTSINELAMIYEILEYSEDLHSSQYVQENILTEFERLFASKKEPVFYLKAFKIA